MNDTLHEKLSSRENCLITPLSPDTFCKSCKYHSHEDGLYCYDEASSTGNNTLFQKRTLVSFMDKCPMGKWERLV